MAPDFNEYIRQGEPDKRGKAYAWRTAIGLQAVDGLQTSEYLKDTARKHIEGEISIDEARDLIKAYYKSKVNREPDDDQKHEADCVSANITKILSSNTLNFSTNGYISIHRRIFSGVLKNAGKIRDYNISKKEWVLDGDSVSYLNWEDLRMALDYDMEQERHFSYKGLSKDELITHIAHFISDLWQIHPFCEGNTRTTAVFAIQYLRSIGFDVNNDLFANHSWYFRNALVRANYKNAQKHYPYLLIHILNGKSFVLLKIYMELFFLQKRHCQNSLFQIHTIHHLKPLVLMFHHHLKQTGGCLNSQAYHYITLFLWGASQYQFYTPNP